MIKFWSQSEYFAHKGLLEWLHTCVDENIKGEPYEHFYYSDGSSSWCYKSKNGLWEISSHNYRVKFQLNDEFDAFFVLRFC